MNIEDEELMQMRREGAKPRVQQFIPAAKTVPEKPSESAQIIAAINRLSAVMARPPEVNVAAPEIHVAAPKVNVAAPQVNIPDDWEIVDGEVTERDRDGLMKKFRLIRIK